MAEPDHTVKHMLLRDRIDIPVLIGSLVGFVTVYALFVTENYISGGYLAPPDETRLLFATIGAYVVLVGLWSGWSNRSPQSTVVVSVAAVLWFLATTVVTAVADVETTSDPYAPFVVVFCAMALGISLVLAKIGYRTGTTIRTRVNGTGQ